MPAKTPNQPIALRIIGSVIPFLFILQGFGSNVAAEPQEPWLLPTWDDLTTEQQRDLVSQVGQGLDELGLPFQRELEATTGIRASDIPTLLPVLYETLRSELHDAEITAQTEEEPLIAAVEQAAGALNDLLSRNTPPLPEESPVPIPENPWNTPSSQCVAGGDPLSAALMLLCPVRLVVALVMAAVFLVVAVALVAVATVYAIVYPYAALLQQIAEREAGITPMGGTTLTSFRNLPIRNYGVAWTGDAFLLFGGDKTTGGTSEAIWRFTPWTNTLQQVAAALPTAWHNGAVAYDGRYAYLFGSHAGYANRLTQTSTPQSVLRYDPVNDQLDTLPVALPDQCCLDAAFDGRFIYLFNQPLTPVVQRFDPQSLEIKPTLMQVPEGWGDGTALSVGSHLYYIGGQPNSAADAGHDPRRPIGFILRYDTSTEALTVLPVPEYKSTWGSPAFVADGGAYVFDGEFLWAQPGDLRIRRADFATGYGQTMQTKLPHGMSGGHAFFTGEVAYLFHVNKVYSYNPATDAQVRRLVDENPSAWPTCDSVLKNVPGNEPPALPDAGLPLLLTVVQAIQDPTSLCTASARRSIDETACVYCPPDGAHAIPYHPAVPQFNPDALNVLESNPTWNPSGQEHDWDGDGIPDALDAVNLPSETRLVNSPIDHLQLPQGLGLPGTGTDTTPDMSRMAMPSLNDLTPVMSGGVVVPPVPPVPLDPSLVVEVVDGTGPQSYGAPGLWLLIDPSHRQGIIVLVDPQDKITSMQDLGSHDLAWALEQIQALHGQAVSDALATYLHEGILLSAYQAPAGTPIDLPLQWGDGDVAGDGSWLMLRTDPTRPVQLVLNGRDVAVTPPSPSRFSQIGQADLRWEFLNPHKEASFCYDAQTALGGDACQGMDGPGWIRSFSGQAAYATDALWHALKQGRLPYTSGSSWAAVDGDSAPVVLPQAPGVVVQAPEVSPPDPDSVDVPPQTSMATGTWTPLGQRMDYPKGLGVDYGLVQSDVEQVLPLLEQEADQGEALRRFSFEAIWTQVPVSPRNLTSLSVGITPLDGNEDGQTFRLDAATLDVLLERKPGESYVVEFDDDHQDGSWFQSETDAQGKPWLLVHVPHFSTGWFQVSTSENPSVNFKDVEMTGTTTGWISGGWASVYRYQSGSLVKKNINGVSGSTAGLHVISDTDFYVVGGHGNTNFVAHYKNGAWTTALVPFDEGCSSTDIWMASSGSLGYMAGSCGEWFKYTNLQSWQKGTSPRPYAIFRDLELDSSGNGYVGLYDSAYSILRFQNGAFSQVSDQRVGYVTDIDLTTNLAVGTPYNSGSTGTYYNPSGTWQPLGFSGGHWLGVDSVPDGSAAYMVGASNNVRPTIAKLTRSGSSWTGVIDGSSFSASGYGGFLDSDFPSTSFGVAVGTSNLVYQYQMPASQQAVSSGRVEPYVSPHSGTSDTIFYSAIVCAASCPSGYPDENHPLSIQTYWGDGSASFATQPTSASYHRYNDIGTFNIVATIYDDEGNFVWRGTKTVTVSPIVLTPGTTQEQVYLSEYPSGQPIFGTRHYHFIVPSQASERALGVQFQGNAALIMRARLDGAAWSDGWNSLSNNGERLGLLPGSSPLYVSVEIPSSSTSGSFALVTRLLPAPAQPSIVQAPAGPITSAGAATYEVLASHPANRPTALLVSWGSGPVERFPAASSSFEDPTVKRVVSHTYAAGSYTLSLTSVDDLGRISTPLTTTVTVSLPLSGFLDAATNIDYTTAKIQGRLLERGGTSQASGTYKLFQDDQLVQTNGPFTLSSSGVFPPWSMTGLAAGTTYAVNLELTNGAESTSYARTFSTATPVVLTPVVVSSNLQATPDSLVSLTVHADRSSLYNMAYWVTWGDGSTEQRYPATGFVPWNQNVAMTHAYSFIADYSVQIRVQEDTRPRSNPLTVTAHIEGPPTLVAGSFKVNQARYTDAILQVTMGNLPAHTGTKMRFSMYSPFTKTWTDGAWTTGLTEGQTVTWTTPQLTRGTDYNARIQVATDSGYTWTSPTPYLKFQANRPPTLTVNAVSASVGPYDTYRLSATYQDPEGDPPVGGAPTASVWDRTITMHAPLDAANYAAGVAFYYVFVPGDMRPTFKHTAELKAADQYQPAATQYTSWTVLGSKVFGQSFDEEEGDVGFTVSSDANNFWHWTDTSEHDTPDRVALGSHGGAYWFANEVRGTYDAGPDSIPYGSLVSKRLDLRDVKTPVLSFSSYYETDTLDASSDHKLVQVRKDTCPTNPDPCWSAWTTAYTVQGHAGGYGTWRSQAVSLASYASNVVEVRFLFNAGNSNDNGHLGWLIDDVYIGHDEDADALPDELEETRKDIRISNQIVPVNVPDQGTARSYVRRLDRPEAVSTSLEALVSHPNPSDLKVAIGWADLEGNQGTPAVIYDGSEVASCQPWQYALGNSPFVQPGGITTRESDGVRIHLDARTCGFSEAAFQGTRDWFLEVTDKAGSGAPIIQSLRMWSVGQTEPFDADTDLDGTSDGAELRGVPRKGIWGPTLDPLGYDSDRDGIHETSDPDNGIPSWAPALRVASDDFRLGFDVEFLDVMAPLTGITVHGVDAGHNEQLDASNVAGPKWHVRMPSGWLPAAVTVEWFDAYGTNGTIRIAMQGTGSSYGPQRIDWQASDAATRQRSSFTQTLSSTASSGFFVAFAVGAVVEPSLTGEAVYGFSLVAVTAARMLAVALAWKVGELALQYYFPPADGSDGNQEACRMNAGARTACIRFTQAVGALTAAEITSTFLNYQYQLPPAGGFTRRIWDHDGYLYYVITTGEGYIKGVGDSFKIRLPTAFDQTTQVIERLITLERARAAALAAQLGLAVEAVYEYAYCMRFCHPQETPDFAQLYSWGDGMFKREPEAGLTGWPMPGGTVLAMHERYNALKAGKDSILLTLSEATLTEASFGQMKVYANRDTFTTHLQWYWYDNNVTQNCNGNPPIRRCATYSVDNSVISLETWAQVALGTDKLETRAVDWSSGHEDTLVGKGLVSTEQLIGMDGEGDWQGVLKKMRESGSQGQPDKDADAAVSYDFLVDKAFEVTVDYRGTQ